MFFIDSEEKKKWLLEGRFGLEMEGLRVDENGYLAHTPHPFPDSEYIVRDFCENQTEINTKAEDSPAQAVEALGNFKRELLAGLSEQQEKEYLWPFSNPPYIRSEEDVPVAQFNGNEFSKTAYRQYLSERYGRYKMAFSGIHVNYSFHEELLKREYEESGKCDYSEYKSGVYLKLAEQVAAYGWILTAVTAASPVMDSSFVEKGKCGGDVFWGIASVRCSELGYWNYFVPVFDYTSLAGYVDSIRQYIDKKWIQAPSELYYPVRVKPAGENRLENLQQKGINHIELRMFDLNPLAACGVDERDVEFAGLLLAWLAAIPGESLTEEEQVQAVQNFKNAAHYDLKTVKIVMPGDRVATVVDAALEVLSQMEAFYQEYPAWVRDNLAFQKDKFLDAENRYAWKIRKEYGVDYVKRGMELARRNQVEADV